MKTLEDLLEEITPQPDPDFVADMERRMQEGFPATRGARRIPRLRLPDLRPRAAAAVAASAMLALLVTVSLVGGGADGQRTETGSLAQSGAEPASEAPSALSTDVAREAIAPPGAGTVQPVPPPPADDVAPQARVRRIERTAQLTLADDPAEFDRIANGVFRTADRHRGFVLRSSLSQGEDAANTGFFDLRVPVQELQPALNELSRLATVRARSESGNDVTAGYLSLRDRLRTAQAERKSLLRRLEVAPTETAAAAIRRRLEIVGRRITSLRSQFRAARERTEFATVLVELVDEDAGPGPVASETDEALDDAAGYLEDILNFLIRAAAILVPVALTAIVVWVIAARARRRARDRALA